MIDRHSSQIARARGIPAKARGIAILITLLALCPVFPRAEDIPVSSQLETCGLGNVKVVPPLLGLTVSEAALTLGACDLGLAETEGPARLSYELIGTIAVQSPASGSVVGLDDKIVITLSAGLYLPDFTGTGQDASLAFLSHGGLATDITPEPNAAPAGTVIAQTPPPGVAFSAGDPITITVSQGSP